MMFKPRDDDEEKVEWDGCRCIGETELAIKVVGVKDLPQWFPKSVIHDNSEVYKTGTDGMFILKRWFAEKEGLI